ncbi:MAG: HipA N-terminal domain-containing protein [Bacteroidales bacterium]|nr:HipA N-terminal domain-containing protein [Bacteroidales bacterium]
MRKGEVYVHGVKAGELAELDNMEYVFAYDQSYLKDEGNPPVSLTLPLREEPYRSDHLFPFFFSMLSEGENRQMQARLLRISPEDDFGILLATAHTDTIGAVTVKSVMS